MSRRKWERWTWAAAAIWLLVFLVIGADVARRPLRHTTMPTYRLATAHWWQGVDLYAANARDTHDGFVYLPQAAVLFTPFALPSLAGDLLWRTAGFGLLAWAIYRLGHVFVARGDVLAPRTWFWLSLFSVPSAMASLRNAQFDLPLAALIVLATVEIAEARWATAVLWLCLALALKPLALVPLLLFGAIWFRTLAPRLFIGLVILAALPFLHWNPAYVAHEYQRCAATIFSASQSHEPRFSDLGGLLDKLRVTPPDGVMTALRLAAAAGFLALAWIGRRRLDAITAAWLVGALSVNYLMLFNPRTETCSYVMLGPFIASLACLEWEAGRKPLAWALGVMALLLASDAVPSLAHFDFHLLTDRWLKPLVALVFLGVLVRISLRGKQKIAGGPSTRSG